MNFELCEYAQIKNKFENLWKLIQSGEQELQRLEASTEQIKQQIEQERKEKEAEFNQQYYAEKERKSNGYDKQISEVRTVQGNIERCHRKLMSDNRNYSIIYKELNENPQILKEFVNCTDAMNTIHNLWIKYSDTYHNSIETRVTNIMFKKRRQEYEYLVIWKNTVDYYMKILPRKLQEELEKWERQRGPEIRKQMNNIQDEYFSRMQSIENTMKQKKMECWNKISQRIEQLFPEMEVKGYHIILERYIETVGIVNQNELIRDGIVNISNVGIQLDVLIQGDNPIAGILRKKFQHLIEGNRLYLPLLSKVKTPVSYYVKADNRADAQGFMEQYLFSQVLRVKASKLTLHVVDCVYQGSSASFLNVLGKQVPYLFDDGILVKEQDVTKRLQQLNEKINTLRQEVFFSPEDTIFNSNTDAGIDVVALYDFPNGITKEGISYLWNIIKDGAACGIYVVMTDGNMDESYYMGDMRTQIENVKQLCQEVRFENGMVKMGVFPYQYFAIWDEKNFEEKCKQYAVATKLIERKKNVSSGKLMKWIESKDEDYVRNCLERLGADVLKQLAERSKVPVGKKEFPEKILLGEKLYPCALFDKQDSMYSLIAEELRDAEHIREPWFFDLKKNQNLLVTMKEQDVATGQRFLHNVLWSYICTIPISKYNICVMDCERKGGSIRPFLEFREQMAELFDETIYTNTDDVYKRLQRYNEMIEERIQSKLGNRYKNILEYNKENETNPEVLHTLAIFDFPYGFDSKSIQLLLNILKNGSKCGVYTIIGYNEDISLDPFDRSGALVEHVKEYTMQIRAADKKYLLMKNQCQLNINLEKYKQCSLDGEPAYEYYMGVYDELFYINENETEQEVLLNTDENGFLIGDSDRYCVDLEKWFLDREEMMTFITTYANTTKKKKQEGLVFENILDETLFAKHAADVLEIPVGIGDQGKKISITFGEKGTSSHHGLITGATGSGKSSLLHTMIMSAMLHYTPEQLQLYLLDFKNGTEFKIYEDYHLPHIQLLALDSMQEFGESILEKLVQVMEERSVLCKNVNAKNLTDYVKSTSEPMPRILVIMDEFQLLYNNSSNSKIAKNCAELTKRLVTEGRAFGIHLLMSTQSARIISSLSLDKEVVGQMRIRVGLKCSEEDTRYLFGDRNEQQAFEWMRGPIGTAVLNEDFVEGNNVGFRVVYCNEHTQKELLQKVAEQFADRKSEKLVFEGNRITNLLEAIEKEKTKEIKGVQIAVGDLLKVSDNPLYISYDRRKSHNTIIVGSDVKMAENISNGLCFSILQKSDTKVYCIDGEVLVGEEDALNMYNQFSRMSESFTVAEVYGDIIRFINEAYDTLCLKKKAKDNTVVFMVFKNLQYLDLVKQMLKGEIINESEYIDIEEEEVISEEEVAVEASADFFNFGLGDFAKKLDAGLSTSKPVKDDINVSQKLLKLINEGSSVGIHFIISCTEFHAVKETLYEVNMNVNKLIQKFPERLLFSLSDMDASLLMDNSVSLSNLPDNTVYYTDSVHNLCMVKPFEFPELERLEEYVVSK